MRPMKSLVKVLLLFGLCVAAQAQESQLFGTRAFLSLPKSYSYACEQLGYVDRGSGTTITATHGATRRAMVVHGVA